jgi:hypothetical protein
MEISRDQVKVNNRLTTSKTRDKDHKHKVKDLNNKFQIEEWVDNKTPTKDQLCQGNHSKMLDLHRRDSHNK